MKKDGSSIEIIGYSPLIESNFIVKLVKISEDQKDRLNSFKPNDIRIVELKEDPIGENGILIIFEISYYKFYPKKLRLYSVESSKIFSALTNSSDNLIEELQLFNEKVIHYNICRIKRN